jgi:hypothetical protein
MKKLICALFTAMLFTSFSFAEPFSPVPLEITVPDELIYAFDGREIDISVDVAGKPMRAYLIINTRLPETDKPRNLRNGYLGWHYVDRIDTTVYISGAKDFSIGTGQKFTWDGIGSENTSHEYMGTIEPSAQVAPGIYDYYVFAYDDKNAREQVCNFVCMSYYSNSQYVRISEYDDFGLPRSQPLLWGNTNEYSQDLHALKDNDGNVIGSAEGWKSHGPPLNTAFKFPIGSDPDDMSAMQTTFMSDTPYELVASPVVFDPANESMFYCFHDRVTQKNGELWKWYWVEGGNSGVLDGWRVVNLDTAPEAGSENSGIAASTDGKYLYFTSPGLDPKEKWDRFYMVSFDGEVVANVNLDDFHTPENPNENYRNGRVNRLFVSRTIPGQALVGGEISCLLMMVNTDRIAEGNTDNYVKWSNGNGDFFLDANWDPEQTDPATLWECNTRDFLNPNAGLHNESWFDSHGIVVQNVDYQGLMSFAILTQDGSGISYCKFAEGVVKTTMSSVAGHIKGSSQTCDSGSAYDGIYLSGYPFFASRMENVNWLAMDSAHGVITDEPVSVKEQKPSAFTVDAPYPNPANPSATIGFTIAEPGQVTIDIYNTAGQKIETLADREFAAGKHSLLWNGAAFSAGVYFCTVRSGGMSETVKIALVK